MSLEIVLFLDAEEDINSSYLWYEIQKPGLGKSFIQFIENSFRNILALPEAFPATDYALRKYVVRKFPFIIYYRIDNLNNQIQILLFFIQAEILMNYQ